MAKVLKPVSKISGSYGQNAEEEISQLLAEELPENFLILNSPRIAYQNDIWDVDHVVIAPTGLFVIESKNMNGKITGGLMGNWVQERRVAGRRERVRIGNPANQVNQYAKIIRQVIRNSYQAEFNVTKNIKAQALVVFAHENSDISKLHYTQPGKVGKARVIKKDELISAILENSQVIYTEEETHRFADILIPPDQRDQTGIYTSLITNSMVESFKSRYELVEEIGRGNFGIVFRAYDTKMDREVAVKKLNVAKKEPEIINRFLREAKITAKLHHDNIVTFYDYFEEDGECYIVMELVEGETLEDLSQSEDLTLDEVVEVFLGITSALQHAHSNGVVHRDLKPANIIVTRDKKAKITDFGIARLSNELNITKTNASVGTPNIMSPEQIMGKDIDHRSDIFAMGVLLFYLITGDFPFQGQSLGEVVNKILHEEPIRPSELNPSLPEGLEAIILQALAKEPEDRFQSSEEMGNAITAVTGLYDLELRKGSDLNIWGKVKAIFKPSYWSGFLSNDQKKFHAITVLTIFIIASLFALQSYKDSSNATGGVPPSFMGDQNSTITNKKGDKIHFTTDNLHLFFANPNQYTGASVDITGRIIGPVNGSMQDSGGDRVPMFEMAITLKNGEQKSILVAYYNPNPHVAYEIAGKDVNVTGIINLVPAPGTFDENVLPVIFTEKVDVIEFLGDWMAKAEKTINVFKSIDRNGKQLTLEKIEFARTETRVHVTLKNKTSDPVHLSFKEPKLIQDDKQPITPLPSHNQQMEFNLEPGQEASGIIYFPALSVYGTKIDFVLESRMFGDEPYVFFDLN